MSKRPVAHPSQSWGPKQPPMSATLWRRHCGEGLCRREERSGQINVCHTNSGQYGLTWLDACCHEGRSHCCCHRVRVEMESVFTISRRGWLESLSKPTPADQSGLPARQAAACGKGKRGSESQTTWYRRARTDVRPLCGAYLWSSADSQPSSIRTGNSTNSSLDLQDGTPTWTSASGAGQPSRKRLHRACCRLSV